MAYPTTNAAEELPAVNEILASVGQAPVTTLDQTNPDVAIAYDTLTSVSREVQAEGWTFNTENWVKFTPDSDNEIQIPNNILQIDLHDEVDNQYEAIRKKDISDGIIKLYEKVNHTFTWDSTKWTDGVRCNVVYLYDWIELPIPVQDYIVARAAAIVSSRIVGDAQQYQILSQKEQWNRAQAMEYECNQGDYTIFGHQRGKKPYDAYKPYQALYR
jgi:hypothetical protein